ncbi:MAG: TolC family protein [Candidatus Omnitrophota bacterium]|jgi:outer membrane protein TolC
MKLLSKNKIRLLKLFYSHPREELYIQQIGRLLGKKPGVFQRALEDLNKEKLVLSEYKANARFFRINTGHSIYNELKSIISKSAKILLLVFLFCVSVLYAGEKPFDLKGAISLAFKNNKDIQMQEMEVRAARANIMDARSRFLPKINMEGSYIHNDKVFAENIFTGYRNDNQIGLTLNESIYSGGANIASFRQAGIGLRAQEETLRAKKLDVEFDAKRLYYGLLLAYETERIASEALGQARAHYADVKHRFDQGTSSRFDLLQSGVQVSLLVPELVKASSEIKLIQAELNKLLGLKIGTPIEIEGRLSYAIFDIEEGEFLKTAYLNKPEMTLKALGIDINKWGIQMAKSGYRPQVDMLGNYYYRSNNTGDMINSNHRNWNIGFKVNIPIFEGFSTKAKVDEAKARYAQALLDKEDLSDQIAVDVRQACLNLKESEAVINSQKDHIDEAREALKIAEISYDAGVGTNLDVLDAQVSLSKIQQNLASATYDYLMAEAYLKRSMGESFLKEEKDEKKS